jgi:formylglycine-generating enzyme required for sulfatase activity
MTACCSPSREPEPISKASLRSSTTQAAVPSADVVGTIARFVSLRGDTFTMGDDGPLAYSADGEASVIVAVDPFMLAATAVTNDDFELAKP